MPEPDKWGQTIGIWQMSDPPSIPDAIKLVAEGVIPRGVLRFASASTRGATLVGAQAPVDGMLTWLEDVARLELRVDGAWVVVAVGARAWNTVTLASGWSQNGNAQGNLQYRVVNLAGDDTIMLRGGISRASYPSTLPDYFTLNTTALPAEARPSSLRTVTVPCSDIGSDRIALKLDITPDGWLRLYGVDSVNKPIWIGFNGVFTSL
ncbi:hypothetical protein ACFVOO_23720 [Streptomyces rochei]|uniref:hypothetical protein n=1 Tax=Streptomyces TaxID=1883 RepID=UPI0007829D13|nr:MULTISPECIES: hypothetical protein [Streptomyces]KYK14292.1 hypothetical protein AUW26_28385 [Streptomyces sp. CC71]